MDQDALHLPGASGEKRGDTAAGGTSKVTVHVTKPDGSEESVLESDTALNVYLCKHLLGKKDGIPPYSRMLFENNSPLPLDEG